MLVADFTIQNGANKPKKLLKPYYVGTHLCILSESCSMNTNMIGFRWSSKIFASLCFGWMYLSIGKGYIIETIFFMEGSKIFPITSMV